mgnify:CR=1 FL=1
MKIGVLGCSSIARRMILPAIRESKYFTLSAVASRSPEKAASYAQLFDTQSYTYDELLKSDVDAIYVSVPVGLHYQWGREVLEHNKHLLMEKTFTQTHAQAKELFELSSNRGLACMEALMYEYHPVQKQIKTCIGQLGEIKYVEAHFGFPHFANRDDIRYSKSLGGGASLDCLIYPLSFIFRTLGSTYSDYKSSIYYHKEFEIDERGYIHLEYPKSTAVISYGFGHSYRNEILVWGEKGIVKTHRAFTRPHKCEIPIQMWENNKYSEIEPAQSNHFVDMLAAFSHNIKTLNNKSADTLERIWFIEKVLNSIGDKL